MFGTLMIAGVGGFFGTAGRYLTGVAAKKIFGPGYPWGTFIVNVVGCFLIGIFFGLWNHSEIDPVVKALLITGFCGGFTTFSSFSHDNYKLITTGQWAKFAVYLISTVVIALAMTWLGMALVS